MIYSSTRLTAEHETAPFDCGTESLNKWIRSQALRAERAGITATTVWTQPGRTRVLAFHAISPTVITREALPTSGMAAGFSSVPGYLLGRLALDHQLHGNGLGSQLLLDAIEVMVEAAKRGGGRVIVVDAIDDNAVSFYEHHDFIRVGETRRLAMKIATARSVVQLANP